MPDKLAPSLDPSVWLAAAALESSQLRSNPGQVLDQSDQLLALIDGGDLTYIRRHLAALITSALMTSHSAMQKAMQCESAAESKLWIANAQLAQASAAKIQLQLQKLAIPAPIQQPTESQTQQLVFPSQNVGPTRIGSHNNEIEPIPISNVNAIQNK